MVEKSKIIKITYKKHKNTGLAAIGSGIYIEVKHKKKMFAIISGMTYNNHCITIQVAVKDGASSWKWIFLKNECQNEEEAKDLIESKLHPIFQLPIHFFEA